MLRVPASGAWVELPAPTNVGRGHAAFTGLLVAPAAEVGPNAARVFGVKKLPNGRLATQWSPL